MKTALAIVCSLVLAWTPIVQAQAPAAGVERATAEACPCPCGQAVCCVAPSVPESQPLSAAPASSQLNHQLLTLAPAGLAWTLPGAESREPSVAGLRLLTAAGAPLYEWNCARLI